MKAFLRRARGAVRRFLGYDELRAEQERQRQRLLRVLSLLEHSVVDPGRVAASDIHRRCADVLRLLAPMDVAGGRWCRVGNPFDGGYVMLEDLLAPPPEAAYSIGVNRDVSWDLDIAARGVDVHLYDHTIAALPKTHPRFRFHRTGLTGRRAAPELRTLGEIVAANGHADSRRLLLKMDIEGCEWDVLDEVAPALLAQFSQIVVELHELCPVRGDEHHARVLGGLRKLALAHQPVHVHANLFGEPVFIAGKVLPDLLEVTFVRREDLGERLVPNRREFPTPLDRPTFEGLPDLPLGRFDPP